MEADESFEAALFCQLPGHALTKHEVANFAQDVHTYFPARDLCLELWRKNPSEILPFSQCLEEAKNRDVSMRDLLQAYKFLTSHGCINAGVPVIGHSMPQPDRLVLTTNAVLRESNLDTDSEKDIRARVENALGLEDGGIKRHPDLKLLFKDVVGLHLSIKSDVSPLIKAYQLPIRQKTVIVIGAGPSGISAAWRLQCQGANVTVLEARHRVGGRVHTVEGALSVPVDFGAQLCTGTKADVGRRIPPDPSSLLAMQASVGMIDLGSNAPLFDGKNGEELDKGLDDRSFSFFNAILDDVMRKASTVTSSHESLGQALNDAMAQAREIWQPSAGSNGDDSADRKCGQESVDALQTDLTKVVRKHMKKGDEEPCSAFQRAVYWHWANLEYGCSADLDQVSLTQWNQDERFGAFGGPHAMLEGGYGQLIQNIASQVKDVRLSCPVSKVSYSPDGVVVTTAAGEHLKANAVVVAVPIGVLQHGGVAFDPPLPAWKSKAMCNIGMGKLNKVFLEFEEPFWETKLPKDTQQFGVVLNETPGDRGFCSNFWNFKPFTGANILCGLMTGSSAINMEGMADSDVVHNAISVLCSVFGEIKQPLRTAVTRWGEDPYAYGSYSFVGVKGGGEDYDLMARPVGRTLLFCGEHTSKEHLDTVGGAMLTGQREACRLLAFFSAGASSAAERVAALAQHEGFLDASTIGRPATTKSTGKAVGTKRRSPSSGDVSPRTKSKQKSKKRAKHDVGDKPAAKQQKTKPATDSMLENELSEMNRDELKRFYECMEQFRNVAVQSPAYKAAEGKLGDFLAGLNLPEDMSQIIRCLKSEPEASRTKLGRSVVCLQAFTSWATELAEKRTKASDRAISGLTDILKQLHTCCNAAQKAQLPQALSSLTRLGPEDNRVAVRRLCAALAPPRDKTPDDAVKVERSIIKAETAAHNQSASSLQVKGAQSVLPPDGAHLLHSSVEDAMWDQMDPAAAEKFRTQVAELKRKLDVLQSAHTADADLDPEAIACENPTPPQCSVGGSHSPSQKRHKSTSSDGFTKAVLQIVKKKLDSDYKLGRITREEYRGIAKKATNKVKVKTKESQPTQHHAEKRAEKITRLVEEYVVQAIDKRA